MRVLIVGAGVGGLTLARVLTRAGIAPKIVDARPASAPRKDKGLGIWDAAQEILRGTLGDGWMREHAHLISPASYRSTSGIWLSRPSASQANEKRVATMHQNDLLTALSENVEVERGKQVIAVEQQHDRSVVRFADGRDEEAELVVGADGIQSAVRGAVFPDAELRATGKTCYSAISKTISMDGTAPFEMLGRSERSGRSWLLPPDPGAVAPGGSTIAIAVIPLGGGKLFWFATLPTPPLGLSDSRVLQALPSVFGGFHEPVPAVLAEAQRGEGELLREEVSALARPLASFSRGRVALIGDAAHPLPPNLAQGAAVAIEDAEALARALAASPENLGAALCAYDAARLPRVAACRRVTNMTRAIAAAPEAAALMQWVPAKVNTAVFDAFLRYSLTARV